MSSLDRSAINDYFSGRGFNIVKLVDLAGYDSRVSEERRAGALVSGAGTGILVGFGGGSFWRILEDHLAARSMTPADCGNPIDDYTREVFDGAADLLGAREMDRRIVYPFGDEALRLDFMLMGELCGVGVRSLLGILINPEFGTWISLRGMMITSTDLGPPDPPLAGFDPCPGCSKPCIDACPAGVVSRDGWDYRGCMRYRVDTGDCGLGCASRLACPVGAESAYPSGQLSHHQSRVLGLARRVDVNTE